MSQKFGNPYKHNIPLASGISPEEEIELAKKIESSRNTLRKILKNYPELVTQFFESANESYFFDLRYKKGKKFHKRIPVDLYKVLSVKGENILFSMVINYPELSEEDRDTAKECRKILVSSTDQLVEANYSLIHFVYSTQIGKKRFGGEFREYEGKGVEGLIIAARKYDYHRKIRFSTMAIPWVKKYVLDHVRLAYIHHRDYYWGEDQEINRKIMKLYGTSKEVSVSDIMGVCNLSEQDALALKERVEAYMYINESVHESCAIPRDSYNSDEDYIDESGITDEKRIDILDTLVQVGLILDKLPLVVAARLRANFLQTTLPKGLVDKLPSCIYALRMVRKNLKIRAV